MSNSGKTVDSYGSQSLMPKTHDRSQSALTIFILCDTCRWDATYFDKTRIPMGNICPQCSSDNNSELTSFPIASNESFTYNYNDKREIEFEFKPRRKHTNV